MRMCDSDPPADDHPAERVDDEAHVGHPGPGRHEGQIGHPQLIGCGRGEVAAHQIGMPRRGRVGFGGADPFAAPDPGDARRPHQPGDLVTADVVAGPAGGLPQLAGPVDPVVVLPQLQQHRRHHRVAAGPRRRRAGLGRVVGARGHLHACRSQDGADGLDPELVAVGVDERDYFLCWRSSSAPKKLAARFRISLARLSSRISCSRSLIRCGLRGATPRARTRRRCRPDAPRTAPTRCRTRAGGRPDAPSRARCPTQPATPAPSAPRRPSPPGCTDASSASQATCSFGMTPSSFPRSGASTFPRAIQGVRLRRFRHRRLRRGGRRLGGIGPSTPDSSNQRSAKPPHYDRARATRSTVPYITATPDRRADSTGRRNTLISRRCSMAYGKRQLEVRGYRGQIPSPGRPTVAWRQDRVRFWAAIAAGATTQDPRLAYPCRSLRRAPTLGSPSRCCDHRLNPPSTQA